MVSSRITTDYKYVTNPQLLQGVSETNAATLRRWIDRQRINNVSPRSIETNVVRVASWMRTVGEELNATDWTVADIEHAYLIKMDEVAAGTRSPATLEGEIRALRSFWSYLDKPPLSIKPKKTRNLLLSSDYISTEQALQMRDAAERAGCVRDAAIIMLLLGTGCRLSEIADACVKDITITRQFATLHVDGKTGERVVPFVTGLPEVQLWLNCHPRRLADGTIDPDAPLFTTYQSRGHSVGRLKPRSYQGLLQKYGEAIGLQGVKYNPHAFRHRAASEDAHDLTTKELCLKFGWSAYSDMPARYTHTSDDELKTAVLKAAGVKLPEVVEDKTATTVQCPRCGTVNRADATYCYVCSFPLKKEFATELIKIKKENEEFMQSLGQH